MSAAPPPEALLSAAAALGGLVTDCEDGGRRVDFPQRISVGDSGYSLLEIVALGKPGYGDKAVFLPHGQDEDNPEGMVLFALPGKIKASITIDSSTVGVAFFHNSMERWIFVNPQTREGLIVCRKFGVICAGDERFPLGKPDFHAPSMVQTPAELEETELDCRRGMKILVTVVNAASPDAFPFAQHPQLRALLADAKRCFSEP